jgi:hypothetical protein
MPRYRLSTPLVGSWADDDVLVVLVGTLNAADLDSSDPAGGTEYARVSVADALDAEGDDLVIEIDYSVDPGTCGTLPVGIAIEDAHGNRSATWEYQGILNVRTPPVGVGRPTAEATENPGEALITWTGSESIEA